MSLPRATRCLTPIPRASAPACIRMWRAPSDSRTQVQHIPFRPPSHAHRDTAPTALPHCHILAHTNHPDRPLGTAPSVTYPYIPTRNHRSPLPPPHTHTATSTATPKPPSHRAPPPLPAPPAFHHHSTPRPHPCRRPPRRRHHPLTHVCHHTHTAHHPPPPQPSSSAPRFSMCAHPFVTPPAPPHPPPPPPPPPIPQPPPPPRPFHHASHPPPPPRRAPRPPLIPPTAMFTARHRRAPADLDVPNRRYINDTAFAHVATSTDVAALHGRHVASVPDVTHRAPPCALRRAVDAPHTCAMLS